MNKVQLEIIYLFMNANGKRTKEECSTLCTYVDISVDEVVKKEIDEYIQALRLADNSDNSSAIIAAIDELLGFTKKKDNRQASVWFSGAGKLNENKTLQARTLWKLIKLAYFDNDYSVPEQRIIEYLINQWKFDKNLYYELVDTVETELALLDKCNWLCNTDKNRNPDRRSTMLARIQGDLQRLPRNLKITINEADI